jgi:hypothetical protein
MQRSWFRAPALSGPRPRGRRGMSLVEVLVAVAILLGLMSVLSIAVMAVFHDSRVDTARIAEAREAEAEAIRKLRERPTPPPDDAAEEQIGGGVGGQLAVAPVLVAEDLDVTLLAAPVLAWPRVHTDLEVQIDARFVFENPHATATSVAVAVPLPERARSLRVTAQRPGEEPFIPPNARYERGGVSWVADVPPGERVTVGIAYATQARDELTVDLLPMKTDRPVDVDLDVTLPEGFGARATPEPTARSGRTLSWSIAGAVDPPDVELSLPAGQTRLGRIAGVCRLAALGLLLFCAGFWYLNEGERPGHLDDFHLGGVLLLALNYGTFFAVFAVLAVHVGLWGAPIAAAVSLPLLTLHVARLTAPRFALTRAMPLAVGTVAAILGYVWLDAWRPLVALGAGVAAMAVVTVTWRSWSSGRKAWTAVRSRQEVREGRLSLLRRQASALRHAVEARGAQLDAVRRALGELPDGLGAERAEVVRSAARLERAIARGRTLLMLPTDWEPCGDAVHEARCAGQLAELERAVAALDAIGDGLGSSSTALEAAARRAADELSSSLAGLDRAVDALVLVEAEARTVGDRAPERLSVRAGLDVALDQVGALREAAVALSQRVAHPEGAGGEDLRSMAVTARQLAHAADRLTVGLRSTIERLADALAHAGMPEAEDDVERISVHCPACGGAHVEGSRFCSGCGMQRPVELCCGACGRVNRLARHLLRDDWHREPVHCGACGVALKLTA